MLKRSSAAVVLVTGCSSGIGKAICDRLAAGGTTVYGGSRTSCTAPQWSHLPLDVTDQSSVDAAVADVLRRELRLDALVACAGIGLAGSLEDTEDDEAKRHFDTNFFGTARMIRAVLPAMRKQSSGKVVVIGSIGGLIGLPFVPYYSASKFALDGLVEALRGEVAPFGIQATIVHPGDLNTGFGANRVFGRNVGATSAYQDRFQDTLQFYAAQESKRRIAASAGAESGETSLQAIASSTRDRRHPIGKARGVREAIPAASQLRIPAAKSLRALGVSAPSQPRR